VRGLRDLIVHLRLHYQLLFLSPLFLWGVLLGGGPRFAVVGIGFVAFHVFLYGGITAYNSYYDRDEGPVGGLLHPPRVAPALLGFSLGVQGVGLALSLLVSVPFAALYAAVMVLSVAYSHPGPRWKGRPVLSLVVVAFGQGAVAFAGGWLCSVAPSAAIVSSRGLLGVAVAALSAVGLYPLTQVYQIDEDRRRGDRTFAVAFGADACFRFAIVSILASAACMVPLVVGAFGAWDGVVVGGVFAGLVAFIASWRRSFQDSVERNFRILHRLQLATSVGTLCYMATRIALT
jgi:4-hydroxybenzoate polyprenyltransferase